jgi:tetratricopeptide (TPR) repeat protein
VKPTLAALLVLAIAAPALAQSKRYPPEPVDKDQEKADHSDLWESATNPAQEPYRALLVQARQGVDTRSADQLLASIKFLDDAIALVPSRPEAYRLRGDASFYLGDWARCAADLEMATQKATANELLDKKATADLQLRLGNCQARSGKLADAERTLAEVAAAGTGNGESLMRLGEIRIALGKLDEAIAALQAALEAPDVQRAQTGFLLASAFDRARRPAEAIATARIAAGFDRLFTQLENPQLPFLGAGEANYLLGLAHASQESPRAEYALIYFRMYVKLAPESPWRKRAEEHLKELRSTAFPESVQRKTGGAALDLDAAALAIRKQMPAMRACLAKLAYATVEVSVTKTGPSGPAPKTPPPPPNRYRVRQPMPPPEGIAPRLDKNADATSRADVDGALRCVEPLAAKVAYPAVKERDGYYTMTFLVVGN